MNRKIKEKKCRYLFLMLGSLLFIILSLILFVYLPSKGFPADDALILFRYAENLAQTNVITFNLGEPPVEGATDFLWMVVLAGLYACGIDSWAGVLLISYLSLLGTSWILYDLLQQKDKTLLLLIILMLMVFNTTLSAIVGFSTLFFGFFIVLTLYCEVKNKTKPLFVTSLITCLIRPDGLVFVIPVIARTLLKNRPALYETLYQFVTFFVIPGLIYFFWRYQYFGFFFPLSFYIKNSQAIINVSSLIENILFNVPFFIIITFLFIYLLYTNKKLNINYIIYFSIIIIFPLFFYSKISLLQNVCNRFQYPFVLIHLVIISLICKHYAFKKIFITSLVGLFIYSLPQTYKGFLNIWFSQYQNLYHVAQTASDRVQGVLFLTTEAGVVPYYTGWKTVDAFGLNTTAFTKKIITPVDIKNIAPDVVLINHMWDLYHIIDNAQLVADAQIKSWQGMVINIVKGLDRENYDILMLPAYDVNQVKKDPFFALQQSNHNFALHFDKMYYCFFIRKNFKQVQEIEIILRARDAIPYDLFREEVRPALEQEIRRLNLLPDLFPPD